MKVQTGLAAVGTTGVGARMILSLAAATLLSVTAIAACSGCGGRSSAATDGRETRLTTDGTVKYYPKFSHDDAWIAYAGNSGGGRDAFAVYVLPRSGGEPRKLSPDSLSVFPLEWSADDQSLLCVESPSRQLYLLGLDGSVRPLGKNIPLTKPLAVTPDGGTVLLSKFNRDNRDIAFRHGAGELEYLAETPNWEEEAVFGPGPGEVTVVAAPSYMAPANSISIWSPTTRAYAPLPLPEGRKRQPVWAPDGDMLAYVAVTGGQSDLWLYDPATTRATPLVEDPQEVSHPAWARDGEWLAFVRGTTNTHLFAGAADAPNRRQLTHGTALDASPAVSPDGQWVAFIRRPRGGAGAPSAPLLCVMPAAGGPVRELDLKGVTLPGSTDEMLAWSRDSRHLAFNGSDGTTKMDIHRIGRDGTGLARVTVEPGEELSPRWSPDGRFIVFTQAGGRGLEVAIVPAHGGLPRRISPRDEKCEGGVWAPGSDRLAYVNYGADGHSEIWTATIAEPVQRRRLLEADGFVWPVFWTDDGKEIVLWRSKGDGWRVQTLALDGGAITDVGWGFHTGKDMGYNFGPEAAKYEKLFYPGGVIVADGEDSFDLYVRRARERRLAFTSSQKAPWASRFGAFAMTGCL